VSAAAGAVVAVSLTAGCCGAVVAVSAATGSVVAVSAAGAVVAVAGTGVAAGEPPQAVSNIVAITKSTTSLKYFRIEELLLLILKVGTKDLSFVLVSRPAWLQDSDHAAVVCVRIALDLYAWRDQQTQFIGSHRRNDLLIAGETGTP
jgi:hypothetical protein